MVVQSRLDAWITGNQTIISKNGTFELGFLSPNGTNNSYTNIIEKMFVWVANRENPARNSDDNKSETVWQIFDHPLDTLLPGTRFGGQRKLVSWKSSLGDPASGLSPIRQIPEITNKGLYNISVENTNSALISLIPRWLSRMCSHISSLLSLEECNYMLCLMTLNEACAVYGLCGAYGNCNSNNLQFCSCVEGFSPTDKTAPGIRKSGGPVAVSGRAH
ncbi:hypothetical protein SUGI_0662950 [Cryptomeria japonica]|nr:hypothetical protein SUGI_0662950 [Cryptomeria japonica]